MLDRGVAAGAEAAVVRWWCDANQVLPESLQCPGTALRNNHGKLGTPEAARYKLVMFSATRIRAESAT